MDDIFLPTIDELKKSRAESLRVSEKAIYRYPGEYIEIKKIIKRIVSSTLDIGDYYNTTVRLSRLLEKMMVSGSDSIFSYYYKNIDPQQEGDVRYFRAICLDLHEQIKHIDAFRAGRHNIRLI